MKIVNYERPGRERLSPGAGSVRVAVMVMLALALAFFLSMSRPPARAAAGDWTTFLGSNARTGYNGSETIINPLTVANLKVSWMRTIKKVRITAEPIVANGMVYWGAWNGTLHASRVSDGTDVWTDNLGTTQGPCQSTLYGVLSTPTLATISLGSVPTSVLFVGGGNTSLYALDANSGSILWQTSLGSSSHFLYSATAVYQGSVYIGVASLGECSQSPVTNGWVDQLDAASGKILNTFVVQTPGCGGSVWGSPAIDEVAGTVYFATGNHGKNCTGNQYTSSLVELNASDLSFVASWKKPKTLGLGDDDFGSTPTLFSATIKGVTRSMVGLVNKNGVYYAFDRANIGAGPLWTAPIAASGSCPECGQGSISSSSYDGHALYVAGGSTTIIVNGVSTTCAGSIDALDPATGNFIWRDCLSHPVLAPVTTLPGLVVVGSGPLLLIMSTTDGSQLFSYQEISGGRFWGPATVSNGVLYQGNIDGNFYAFMPK